MKKALLYLSILIPCSAGAQISSNCIVPPQLADVYHKDIIQLATNYLYQVSSPDTALVRPPQQTVDAIIGGLAAILNATSIPERDSVFNLYCVHNLNGWPYDYAGFLVQVDTSYAWTQAWQNLNTVTGNSYMDSLTSSYALHITNFYNWSFGNYAELGVDSAWNIMALMDSLRLAQGVLSVEPNSMIGEAGWIDYHLTGSDRIYDFYFEFNDCFDGCDNYHRWRFKVDTACTVYYLGFIDWGAFGISPLPAPVNCNLFTSIKNFSEIEIAIFPNPVASQLIVNTPSKVVHELRIFNAVGQQVSVGPVFPSERTTLDVRSLPGGIYFLGAVSTEGISYQRFIKE